MRLPTWNLPQRWVLIISLIVLLLSIVLMEGMLLYDTGGVVSYPYDDAYVRMAIGKNIAFHHFWGLSHQEFCSASSSIIYPLLLAGLYKLLGIHLIIPLLVNVIVAVIVVIYLAGWLQKQDIVPVRQLLILLFIILITPLPLLVMTGMEHTLQILFCLLFMIRLSEWLAHKEMATAHRRMPWILYVYGLLLVAIRYEGIFLIGLVCLLLLIRRKIIDSLLLLLVAAMPIVLFGLYSIKEGGYFVPNNLMMKSMPIPLNFNGFKTLLSTGVIDRIFFPYLPHWNTASLRLLIVLPFVYWLFIQPIRENTQYRYLLILSLGMALLHISFVDVGRFYRYEAYLMACSFLAIGLFVGRYFNSSIRRGASAWWMLIWTIFILAYPFYSRDRENYIEVMDGCRYMYERDYLSSLFVQKYYNNIGLVADDLGAISYSSEAEILDICSGNGNAAVVKSREKLYHRPEFLEYLVVEANPYIAIVAENKYDLSILQKWIKVASWRTNYLIVQGNNEICYYAVNKEAVAELKRNLQAFEPQLPASVKVKFF